MPENANMNGRRVLLVAPRFFGYERRIAERLTEQGAEVTFVDDRPSNNTLAKALIRLSPGLIQQKLEAYHQAEIRRIEQQCFDDLLFIVPESCSAKTIGRYRAAFPGARILLYMWDSFKNKSRKDVPGFLSLFDRAYSFDDQDCKKFGMHFRPLFFCKSPSSVISKAQSCTYAFSFIGTIHSDRFKILKCLGEQADLSGHQYFIYPFLPSKVHYWLYKLTRREFWPLRQSDFRFDALPYAEVLQIMGNSLAIVDIEHPNQRGLTMRTLEVIGSGRKLITTNSHVADYSFYSTDRICVIDREEPRIPPGFLTAATEPILESVISAYGLDGWLESVFSEAEAPKKST